MVAMVGVVLRYSRRFFNIGVYQFKLSLYRDLAKDNPQEIGFISFPRGLPDSYFEERVCERRVPYKRMGVIAYRWEKPDRQANEMHDCFLYASAAAIKYGDLETAAGAELIEIVEMQSTAPHSLNLAETLYKSISYVHIWSSNCRF